MSEWPEPIADAAQPPPVPEPRLVVDAANQQRQLEALGLDTDTPVVALMPGAEYGPAKCWPLPHYGQVAAALAHKELPIAIAPSVLLTVPDALRRQTLAHLEKA